MSKDCLDIGAIQAYIDGELSPAAFARVSEHSAACGTCANLLEQADEENAAVFATLGREMDSLVPTQRLWTRITESIETEKSKASVWERLYTFVFANIASPTLAAATGLLIVFGLSVFVLTFREATPTGDISASVPEVKTPVDNGVTIAAVPGAVPNAVSPAAVNPEPAAIVPVAVSRSNHSPEELRKIIRANDRRRTDEQIRPQYLSYQYIPGEESYIKTISAIEQGSNDSAGGLSASGQVAYQRDLAVVEESIKRMREVVKKNPRNQAAKQVLYSSYQDKIDLLNASRQRDELLASIR